MAEIHPTDIISCESEELHTIGFIQNHAYLLAIDFNTFQVKYHSENFFELLNEKGTILGKQVSALEKNLNINNNLLITDLLKVSLVEGSLSINNPYCVRLNDKKYNVILSKEENENVVILEFEEAESTVDGFSAQNLLGEVLLELNITGDENIEKSLQLVAGKVRQLVNYDRVMIYKFWEDAHGEVIAEDKKEELKPFKGLHFPATDIPRQARELYVENITRILVDVNEESVPILSDTGEPLNLTHAQSRAISKVHIEYLKNMGVKASYSISLIVNGELWGLIACHNYEKSGFIDYDRRVASKIISKYLSNLIFVKRTQEFQIAKDSRAKNLEQLDTQLRNEMNIVGGLTMRPDILLSICNAEGFAVVYNGEYQQFGKCPVKEYFDEIISFLKTSHYTDDIFSTKSLKRYLSRVKYSDREASGILAITIDKYQGEYLIWFRPERISKVEWAGKDEKEYTESEEGKFRISPRKSFEKWEESIENTSEPWTNADIEVAGQLRNKILSVIQHKANEIKRLNIELASAYEELDSFSYTLSHDLRTPLNTIKGYLEIFEEEMQQEGNPMILKMMKNTDIMQEMVDNVLDYSKLGREPLEIKEVNVYELLEDIKVQMADSRKFRSIELNIPNNYTVSGNKMMLYQVFLNLIENAIKYKDPSKENYVKVEVKEYENKTCIFSIKDNGIGIDPQHHLKVFGLFKRGEKTSEIEGSGVGLAIVKKIIERHGGRVWVESSKDEGSTFFVQLNK